MEFPDPTEFDAADDDISGEGGGNTLRINVIFTSHGSWLAD